jgi:glycosyltransferase involved in cell wall biosynthesis
VEIVFTAHNILPHDSGDKYKNIFRKIYTKVHKIIVHDQSTKDEISTVFGIEENKIFVVPHGILSIENKRETKVKHNETIVFSMLGHLNKYKGVDLLIDAWLTSDQLQFSKCKLILAGKASQEIKESLKKLNAIENVKIIDDFLSEEEFENILAITDVLVLPYTKISQSGLMLTAFGYRIPVLVSAIGGLTQPFKIGKVGWILDEISSNDLQNKMYYILKKPTELKLIRKDTELWKKVETFYSWERIGQITSKVYTS